MVSNSWRDTTLGEFVRLQRGHDLPEADRQAGVVPIMGSAGRNGFHSTARARGPGVVIGRSGVGSMGVVSYCTTDFWPHNTVLYVTDFLGNDERFTYYLLRHLNLRRFDSGSAQASLNRNYIYPIRIRVPKPDEQRAIAHILGTLDNKIELNRRMNETLEATARTIFRSWFVDFDSVRAKAEGHDPGLPKHIAELFPNRFEDSELGEIPVGWKVGKVEKFATLSRDSINPGEFPDETFEHFSIPAFDEGRTPKRELGSAIKSNKFLIPSDAILLSKLNPRIPRLWLPVVRDNPRAICSTEFLVVLPRINAFREFICGLLSSEAFADVFETLVTGTSSSHQRVRPEGLLSMNVVIPDNSVIRHFSKVVQPLLARMDCAREESQTLAAFRDALLPKLVSGELRVKHAGSLITGSLSASIGVGG